MSEKRAKWRTLILISAALNVALLAGASLTGNVPYAASSAFVSAPDLFKTQFFAPATTLQKQLVFSAPPDELVTDTHELYRPIAEYLSRVTGKQVVYKAPRSWRSYLRGMQRGDYDLVLDSPHFASWRIARLTHDPVVRVAGQRTFVVVIRRDNDRIRQLTDLAGQRVCGPAALQAGGLILHSQFDNPARQPVFVESSGGLDSYQALMDGTCDSAILSLHVYEEADPKRKSARVLFKSAAMPYQTLTAGPRVSAHDKTIIRRALLSPEGQTVTKALCDRFQAAGMTPATESEYAGLHTLLKNHWGFDV
ncbi:MAG: phosphate/phosphite/phosphonate ABC transporter substrate-binding protein [Acidiferrobacterales bacterium]